jgi:hypothetical protein
MRLRLLVSTLALYHLTSTESVVEVLYTAMTVAEGNEVSSALIRGSARFGIYRLIAIYIYLCILLYLFLA